MLTSAHETALTATPEIVALRDYPVPAEHNLWRLVLEPSLTSTGGMVYTDEYGPALPCFGSSSLIVDLRPTLKKVQTTSELVAREELPGLLALPVAQKVRDLANALSLNKSQLAQILRVTRPTVYSWLQGTEPGPANIERLHGLLTVLGGASVSGTAPLSARFVRHRPGIKELSILELLSQEALAPDRIVDALKKARELETEAASRRSEREERLRSRGFEELNAARRREQLATNMALKAWPR